MLAFSDTSWLPLTLLLPLCCGKKSGESELSWMCGISSGRVSLVNLTRHSLVLPRGSPCPLPMFSLVTASTLNAGGGDIPSCCRKCRCDPHKALTSIALMPWASPTPCVRSSVPAVAKSSSSSSSSSALIGETKNDVWLSSWPHQIDRSCTQYLYNEILTPHYKLGSRQDYRRGMQQCVFGGGGGQRSPRDKSQGRFGMQKTSRHV